MRRDHARGAPPPAARLAVWALDISDPGWDVAAAARTLTRAERDRAGQGSPAVARRRVLLRAGLRAVLGRLLGLPPAAVPLLPGPGRPGLGCRSRLEVSCSAGGGLGLIAVTPGLPVGVDVEPHRDADTLAEAAEEGWLTGSELAVLAALPPGDRPAALARGWTQKEAVLKGDGTGLRRPPVTVPVPLTPVGRSGDWALAPVAVPGGLAATVALCSPGPVPPFPVRVLTPQGAP